MTPTQPASPEAVAPIHPALALACALDAILLLLLHHIAAAFRPLARFAGPAWTRISHANQRLARLLARIAAGTYPAPRPRRPDAAPRKGGQPAPYLPRRRGWLVHVTGFQAANMASQLNHLLARPETLATIAAAPPHARAALARALATPCRLLGIDLPAALRPPAKPKPKPPAAPKPPRVKPAPPLDRPLQPYIRAAARAWRRKSG